ncbi:4Fe-4S binding protein [Flavobacterium sp. JAS]
MFCGHICPYGTFLTCVLFFSTNI